MSALYATPEIRIFEPDTDFLSPWLSACEMTERQKYGMLLFTSPASSMNLAEKSYSRAFQER